MRTTEFYASFALFDTTAREDAAFYTADNQPFGDIALAADDMEYPDYATLEEDFFILDGSKAEMPDDPGDVVYMSTEMSGEDGTFTTPPSFIIDFEENHTSYGLTFYFVNYHPLEMLVEWYGLSGIIIGKKRYPVDGNKFFAQNRVENYGKIKVTFTKAKAHRYVKFRYIEYGTELELGHGGVPVKDASLVEEIDQTSDKIPINKLSVKLVDTENEFDLGNIVGMHKVLQNGQECMAYEYVNATKTFLGKFFLADYGSDKNIVSMSLVDLKGILDNNRFLDGQVYDGEPAGNVIDAIMDAAGIADYQVSDEVRAIPLSGWLKIQTCRKALREVLFACGAIVSSARDTKLNIYIPEKKITKYVARDRKFSTVPFMKDYVSDVTIKYQQYQIQTVDSQILKGDYPQGTHTIELSSPASGMAINSGLILKQSANYVTFQIDSDAAVVITGKQYNKEEFSLTAQQKFVESGNSRNTKSFSCSVLSAKQAQVVADRILDYYRYRLGLKIKYLYDAEMPGQWADVDNSAKRYNSYAAVFEKLTTDLTGGYISTAELRGIYNLVIDSYYTGELIAGESIGDI